MSETVQHSNKKIKDATQPGLVTKQIIKSSNSEEQEKKLTKEHR